MPVFISHINHDIRTYVCEDVINSNCLSNSQASLKYQESIWYLSMVVIIGIILPLQSSVLKISYFCIFQSLIYHKWKSNFILMLRFLTTDWLVTFFPRPYVDNIILWNVSYKVILYNDFLWINLTLLLTKWVDFTYIHHKQRIN